jgi:hypothetical protein
MDINLLAVLVATLAMFVVGAVWYGPVFGKLWGEIHGFDKLSEKVQKEMQSKMAPFYLAQALVTFVTAYVLAYFIAAEKDTSYYLLATLLWVGFVFPTQVSAVIFGGTEGKYILKKVVIMGFGSLLCTLVGAWVISLF